MGEPKVENNVFTKWLNIDSAVKKCDAISNPDDKTECFKGAYFAQVDAAKEDFSPFAGAVGLEGKYVRGIADLCPNVFLNDGPEVDSFFTNESDFRGQASALHSCMVHVDTVAANFQKISPNWKADIKEAALDEKKNTEPPKVNLPQQAADNFVKKYCEKYAEAMLKWARGNQHRFNDDQLKTIALAINNMTSAKGSDQLKEYYELIVGVDKEARDAVDKKAAAEAAAAAAAAAEAAAAAAEAAAQKGFSPAVKQSTKNEDGNITVGSSIGIAKEVETKNFVFSAELNWDLAKLTNVTKDDVGTAIKGKNARDVSNSGFGGAEIAFSKIPVSVDGKGGNVEVGDTTMTLKASYEIESASAGVGFDIALNSTDAKSKATHTITPTLLWTTPVDDLGFNPKVSLKHAYKGDKADVFAASSIEFSACYFSKAEDFKYGFDASLSLKFYDGLFLTPKFGYGDPFGVDNVPNAIAGDYNWNAGLDLSWKPENLDVLKDLTLGFNWTLADSNYNYGGDGGDYDVEQSSYTLSLSAKLDLFGVMTFTPSVGWVWYNTNGLEDVEGSTNGFFFGANVGL